MESRIDSPLAQWETQYAANEDFHHDEDDEPESPFIDENDAGSEDVRELTRENLSQSGETSSCDFTLPKTPEIAACSVKVDERRHKQEIIEQLTLENDLGSHIFKLDRSNHTNEVGRNDDEHVHADMPQSAACSCRKERRDIEVDLQHALTQSLLKLAKLEQENSDLQLHYNKLKDVTRGEHESRQCIAEEVQRMCADKEEILRSWYVTQEHAIHLSLQLQEVLSIAKRMCAESQVAYQELSACRLNLHEELSHVPEMLEKMLEFSDDGLNMLEESTRRLALAQDQGAHVAAKQEALIQHQQELIANLQLQLQEQHEEVEQQRQALEHDLAQMQDYRDTISALRKELRVEHKRHALMRDAATQVVDRRAEAHVRNLRRSQDKLQCPPHSIGLKSTDKNARSQGDYLTFPETVTTSKGSFVLADLDSLLHQIEQSTGLFSANSTVHVVRFITVNFNLVI